MLSKLLINHRIIQKYRWFVLFFIFWNLVSVLFSFLFKLILGLDYNYRKNKIDYIIFFGRFLTYYNQFNQVDNFFNIYIWRYQICFLLFTESDPIWSDSSRFDSIRVKSVYIYIFIHKHANDLTNKNKTNNNKTPSYQYIVILRRKEKKKNEKIR